MTWKGTTMVAVDRGNVVTHLLSAIQLQASRLVLLQEPSRRPSDGAEERRDFLRARGVVLEQRAVRLPESLGGLLQLFQTLRETLAAPSILWMTTDEPETFKVACTAMATSSQGSRRMGLSWVEEGRLVLFWNEAGVWHDEVQPFGVALSFQELFALSGDAALELKTGRSLPLAPRSPEEIVADWPHEVPRGDLEQSPLGAFRASFRKCLAGSLAGLAPAKVPQSGERIWMKRAREILADWLPRTLVAVRGAPGLPIKRCITHPCVHRALQRWPADGADPTGVLLTVVESELQRLKLPRAGQIMAHLRASASKAREALSEALVVDETKIRREQGDAASRIEEAVIECLYRVGQEIRLPARQEDPEQLLWRLRFRARLQHRIERSGFKSERQVVSWVWAVLVGELVGSLGAGGRVSAARRRADHRAKARALQELAAAYLEYFDPKGVLFVDEAAGATLNLEWGARLYASVLLATRAGELLALNPAFPSSRERPEDLRRSIGLPLDRAVVLHEKEKAWSEGHTDDLRAGRRAGMLVVPANPTAAWREQLAIRTRHGTVTVPTLFGFLADYTRKLRSGRGPAGTPTSVGS